MKETPFGTLEHNPLYEHNRTGSAWSYQYRLSLKPDWQTDYRVESLNFQLGTPYDGPVGFVPRSMFHRGPAISPSNLHMPQEIIGALCEWVVQQTEASRRLGIIISWSPADCLTITIEGEDPPLTSSGTLDQLSDVLRA